MKTWAAWRPYAIAGVLALLLIGANALRHRHDPHEIAWFATWLLVWFVAGSVAVWLGCRLWSRWLNRRKS